MDRFKGILHNLQNARERKKPQLAARVGCCGILPVAAFRERFVGCAISTDCIPAGIKRMHLFVVWVQSLVFAVAAFVLPIPGLPLSNMNHITLVNGFSLGSSPSIWITQALEVFSFSQGVGCII